MNETVPLAKGRPSGDHRVQEVHPVHRLDMVHRSLAAGLLSLTLALASARATTIQLETSRLELPGGWELVPQTTPNVHKYLLAGVHAHGAPAVGAIEIPHAGNWHLWVRSKDFPADRPGTRKFSVRIGEARSAAEFGRHGQADLDGWAWEDGGTLTIPAGPAMVVLGDMVASSARCDALVLSDNIGYRPEGVPWKLSKEPAHVVPLTVSEASTRAFLPEPLHTTEEAPVASLEGNGVRFTFHRASTAAGPAIALRVSTQNGTAWTSLPGAETAEGYRVLSRPRASDPKMTFELNPAWESSFSPAVEARCGATTVQTRLGIVTAPWCSGHCWAPRPSDAKQIDAQTVDLSFPRGEIGTLTARWHLSEKSPAAEVTLHFTPKAPGHYSLGYHGPLASPVEQTDFVLLPFEYQAHRFPEQAAMILSAETPTPLALVSRSAISCALTADPASIPFEWPDHKNSRYALGLRNEAGLAQPLLYSPVLGQIGSVSEGAPVENRFRLWVQPGDWYSAFHRIGAEVFALRDYRQPTTASLSDTALNLCDLLRNEEASGWNARAKGPWNIESRNTVTHSSPLTYLSLYLLTGDQDFYQRFARPALEYVLSRPSAHFAAEHEIWDNYYHHQPMKGPATFWGASTFASAALMTQGGTPAFAEFALPQPDQPRIAHANGHTQPFADWLGAYELTRDKRYLEKAIALGDQYVAANLTTLPAKDLGPKPFVNVSFIPDWEGLLHLYEASHEPRFLAAATEGAHWLTTTLWTQPLIPPGDVTIHPGGEYDGHRHVWWFGDFLFRRGIYRGPAAWETTYPPPTKLPEKRVPAWQVSQVGLGLEQPETYNQRGVKENILMSAWAPSLLRLSGLRADDPALRTAARNAFIGRFASYPGYYLDGMTTEYQRPDYPITGPDVTSLYVHHIPPFTAAVLDFLFTDAEFRSRGAVKFPSVRQCGYVWFDSRLYGHAPGEVYGQSAWPWLHRTAAKADNINLDLLLAEGDGKFHVILLNQVHTPQKATLTFDPKVLGRSLDEAELTVTENNHPAGALALRHGTASVTVPADGLTVLTLAGTHIDVPTHRVKPPASLAPLTESAIRHAAMKGTSLEAIGTEIEAPPFTTRDLYVYLTAGIDDCKAARLVYRVGSQPERRVEGTQFPWEFTVSLPAGPEPITWRMEAQLPDGRTLSATP